MKNFKFLTKIKEKIGKKKEEKEIITPVEEKEKGEFNLVDDIKTGIEQAIEEEKREVEEKGEKKRQKKKEPLWKFVLNSIAIAYFTFSLMFFVNMFKFCYDGFYKIIVAYYAYSDIYIKDLESESLVYGAINGMAIVAEDQYGGYVPSGASQMTDNEYYGMGMSYESKDGHMEVVNTIQNSPATEGGLEIGDKITHIDGVPLTPEVEAAFIESVNSGVRKSVVFTLESGKIVEIVFGMIEMPTLEYEIVDGVGYIKIYTFVEKAVPMFKDAFKHMVDNQVSELVIDLRDNSGGYENVVVEMLDYIMKDEIIMKATFPYNTCKDQVFYADSQTVYNGEFPIHILVNENTASAAECMTMVLQDVYNAKVYGTKTFGKSTILSMMDFKDDSMLFLSSGLYLSKSERNIEGVGITPDVVLDKDTLLFNMVYVYNTCINAQK